MTQPLNSTHAAGWAAIERERRIDHWVARTCGVAWVLTLVLAGAYTVVIGAQAYRVWRLQRVGVLTGADVLGAMTPLLIALGVLVLLVATLSTVGVFLRFRTAALSEIQLRLATLESLLSSTRPSPGSAGR